MIMIIYSIRLIFDLIVENYNILIKLSTIY